MSLVAGDYTRALCVASASVPPSPPRAGCLFATTGSRLHVYDRTTRTTSRILQPRLHHLLLPSPHVLLPCVVAVISHVDRVGKCILAAHLYSHSDPLCICFPKVEYCPYPCSRSGLLLSPCVCPSDVCSRVSAKPPRNLRAA